MSATSSVSVGAGRSKALHPEVATWGLFGNHAVAKTVVVDSLREAAIGCAEFVKPFNPVIQVQPRSLEDRAYRVCDRSALDRSLVPLVNDYNRCM